MSQAFNKIGIIGRTHKEAITDTLEALITYLQSENLEIVLDEETGSLLPSHQLTTVSRENLGAESELVIVVGGDGSMLTAVHAIVSHHTPIIGINRGRLGFLTDIRPDELESKLGPVLKGNYFEERRFLLHTDICDANTIVSGGDALNDVVLLPGSIAHMIEFEIQINNKIVCRQRADGLIIATPTGSTAYALSGGGPILHPKLDAIVLVPMFPHTLSSRPIVVDGNSEIKIQIDKKNETSPRVSCDGHERMEAAPGQCLCVNKKPGHLRLIHPAEYDYYETLREKLHWEHEH